MYDFIKKKNSILDHFQNFEMIERKDLMYVNLKKIYGD